MSTPVLRQLRDDGRSGAQRRELARFLRAARERVRPDEVGVAVGARRRAPGLLREEVAQRASISSSWYSWLEQGRDIQASAQVLTSVAAALRLTADETDYMFTLAGATRPPAGDDRALRGILHQLVSAPAYLVDPWWNIVDWNAAADRVCGLAQVPPGERHALRLALTGRHSRVRFVDPFAVARLCVAEFRADTAQMIGDRRLETLVEDLARDSVLFRRLWSLHEVRRPAMNCVEYRDGAELVRFDFVSSRLGDAHGLRLHAFLPCSSASTAGHVSASRGRDPGSATTTTSCDFHNPTDPTTVEITQP
jgi:transcriptional regulator with XRE-family HTH domain